MHQRARRFWIFVLLLGLSGLSAFADEAVRTFTDSAGRTITVPLEVKKVYSVGHPGTVLLYSLCREKLAAWNAAPSEIQKKFIKAGCLKLPVIGGWGGSNTRVSLEELIAIHPDVIVSIGEASEYWKSNADRVQEQTGIPVALIAGELSDMDKTYRKAAELVGAEERGEKLARYCREKLDAVREATARVPEDKRVKVYYAEGPRGLQTDPPSSFHTQVLEFVHGINVASSVTKTGVGRTDVSIESVITWAPQCILVEADTPPAASDPLHTIFSDSAWQAVPAIRNGNVHVIPQQPYNWFGRPPSTNRLLGVQWLAHALYPEAYPVDIVAVIQEYYNLFYDVPLSADEARRLERGEVLE